MTATLPKQLHQTDLIKVSRLGHTFVASRRTVAWLDHLIWQFNRTFPKARLVILQPCYHSGVAASAGTHDFDACFDLWFAGKMPGITYRRKGLRFSRFMRNRGASGGWFRRTGEWANPYAWHFHCFPLPVGLKKFTTKVGIYIDGGESQGKSGYSSQLVDYVEENAMGLASEHGYNSDPDRRQKPKNLHSVVFNYHAWVAVHGVPRGI